jgi:hypothetical protein|tara:strand:- start:3655 stop:3897 length:243 start_codon:yes stop_codon:yes gene_type:complete
MKSLNKRQRKALLNFGYHKKTIKNLCKIPDLQSITVVDKNLFIYDLNIDGSITPKEHNLQEDFKKKEIESCCIISGDYRV